MPSCCRGSKDKLAQAKSNDNLSLKQKFAFGCGHVLNDLIGSAWFSYVIVFLTKVAGLTNPHAGYVVLSGQIMEATSNPFIGQFCDKTVSSYGRRKLWHLIGTIVVSITIPMLFMRCIGCEDNSSIYKLGYYYIPLALFFCTGWGATQIGHLALIPEICKTSSEAIELSALRSAVTFICGVFMYLATWVLLGQSKEASLSPKVWKQFMYLGILIVGIGNIFNLIFHIIIKEPPSTKKDKIKENNNLPSNNEKALLEVSLISKSKVKTLACNSPNNQERLIPSESTSCSEGVEVIETAEAAPNDKTWKDWLKYPQFYTTNMLFTCSRLVVNISQTYLPLYLTETLRFEKESIAYFPLLILITGVLASFAVKPLNHRLGSKIAFIIGSFLALGSCFWFFLQPIEGRNAVYAAAILIGCGGSIMLSTSLSMIAELIGEHKTSGAFVYGTIGFTDKVSSGFLIAIIQQLNPRPSGNSDDCGSCDQFVRLVLSLTPGCSALAGLIIIILFFESIFVCKRQVNHKEKTTQTENEDMVNRADSNGGTLENRNANLYPSILVDSHSLNSSTDSISVNQVTSSRAESDSRESSDSRERSESRETGDSAGPSNSIRESTCSVVTRSHGEIDHSLFEKRNFLSTSLCTLESQAAVRLATYDKMSPRCWRRSMAV